MDVRDIRRIAGVIGERLRRGEAPLKKPMRTWGGPSRGEECAGCGRPIRSGKAEIECEVFPARHVFFHPECFSLWKTLLAAAEACGVAPGS